MSALGTSLARAGAVALGDLPTDARWQLITSHGVTGVANIQWVDGGAWSALCSIRYVVKHGDSDGKQMAWAARYADRAISREPSPFAARGDDPQLIRRAALELLNDSKETR